MDPELDFVAPVRTNNRRRAPIDPSLVSDDWEPSDPFYCISFDPGGTTGWAVFGIWPQAMHDPRQKILDNMVFWSAGQFSGTEAEITDQIMSLIEAWPDETSLLSEDFILRHFSMSRDLLSPVRINARIEDRLYVVYRGTRCLNYQSPSLALGTITDDRLKAWGFWNQLKGQEHARAAVKHNITWLRRLKEKYMAEIAMEASGQIGDAGA